MPEPITPDEKKEKSIGQEVREKSFHQILKEQQEERNKPVDETTPVKTEEEKKAEEEKAAKEAEEAKVKAEADKKAEDEKQAQLAKQAAEEVLRKQEDEREREQDRIKAEDAEKARQESLKPKWHTDPNAPKDENGNPLPKSYDEITAEAARIGEEKAYARIKAEEAERTAAAEKAAAEKMQNEEQIKKQQEDAEKQLQTELDTDLNDLYAANKLPKIKDPKDENDPGNKEFRNLFETAQRVNAERMAKGQQPIRSIKLIYYEHYKPLPKPAGHNAPVIGSESTTSTEPPEDKYVVSRDRGKSMQQLVKEEAQRLAKKVGVRSK
jgi:hypothetical protein